MNVSAKTFFVWTEQAQEKFSDRVAGTPVWKHYRESAPVSLVQSGDIIDSEDYEGQTDLFTMLEEV